MSVGKGCLGTFGGLVLFFIGLPLLVLFIGMVKAVDNDRDVPPAAVQSEPGSAVDLGAAVSAAKAGRMREYKRVQQALAERGYDPGPVDGELGPKTKAAIADFQRANWLEATGFPDPRTRELLGLR